MGFTEKQADELGKPLDRSHVKEREQGGRQLSYIESWHVISEANRIFGFDGWDSETVEIKCAAEHARKIGRPPNQRDGWGVTYTAKVRIAAVGGGVVREGVGAGHGIDADLGLAHESAIKEAESDARKRALMTFGNPFGLALYDKTQANVADTPRPSTFQAHNDAIDSAADLAQLKAAFDAVKSDKSLTQDEGSRLIALKDKRKADLAPKSNGVPPTSQQSLDALDDALGAAQ